MVIVMRLIGGAAWVYAALYSLTVLGESALLVPILMFWIGTIWAIWIWLRGDKRAPRRQRAGKGEDVVTVVAPRGGRSHGPTTLSALPEYTRHLFGDRG